MIGKKEEDRAIKRKKGRRKEIVHRKIKKDQ